MKRAILLQTEATMAKAKVLREFSTKAVQLANSLLKQRTSMSLISLHKATYLSSKKSTSFGSQVICDIERQVCKTKANRIKNITVKCNVPRAAATFKTKSLDFVKLTLYPRQRISIPIKKNRSWERYSALLSEGWVCKTYGLTTDGQIVAYLSKNKEIPDRPNVLGIDINAKHFAISVVSPDGKVLYQAYFGKHIYERRKRILERRALLQSLKNEKKLAALRTREQDFVRTNLAQMTKEIIKIAKRFNAEITIEDLKRFEAKGRKFNKTVMRIPFFTFREILSSRCFDNDIPLKIVDSWHTSKWCTHCGAVGQGHSANYAIFRCKKCDQIVNSDRKASLAIAVKSLVVRKTHGLNNPVFFQFTARRVPVNGLVRSDDGVDVYVVHNDSAPRKADQFIGR